MTATGMHKTSNERHILCISSANIRSPESSVVVVGHVGTIKKTKSIICIYVSFVEFLLWPLSSMRPSKI
jgi:hypothetical protein